MFPLRDINPIRSTPLLVYALIIANVVVFLYELSLPLVELERLVFRFGVIPRALTVDFSFMSLSTPITSMFLHGGWLHLISNMWFLYIFGDNIEDTLGFRRFAYYYLLCGLAGAAAQVVIDPLSPVPMVGASGAISGVLGGYFRLFPRARVLTLIPIFVFFFIRELPAVLFIFLWFLIQLFGGLGSLGAGVQSQGVAFFAHIGGFVAGFLLIKWLKPPRNRTYGWVNR
ncbi:MAG: rhomboid family intramembrane serine protease [Deltaproteobacteria bacterium]|nr:rhomboid family intramembrane serine protease [Deltaproteobacteria bacterium]